MAIKTIEITEEQGEKEIRETNAYLDELDSWGLLSEEEAEQRLDLGD